MLKFKIILFYCLSIILINDCDKGPTEADDKDYAINAKIVDSNNNPLTDVNFHYIFYVGSDIVAQNMGYSFILQSNDTVTIKVFNCFDKEVAILLNNASIFAGNYSYYCDASSLTNGIYTCTIKGSTINQQIKSFALTDDVSKLLHVNSLIKSDLNGSLNIPFLKLGIGNKFIYQNGNNEQEYTIADSINIVLHKDGYETLIQKIKLDLSKDYNATFILQNN